MMSEELNTPSVRHRTTARRLGWMAAALLTVGALLAPSSAALGTHVDGAAHVDLGASGGTDQSGTCTGDFFKIESAGVLVEGTNTFTGTTDAGLDFEVTLTVVLDDEGEVESISFVSSNFDIDAIVIKGGGGSGVFTVFRPPFDGPLTAEQGAISNVSFCLGEMVTTTTTTGVSATTTTVPTTTTTTTGVSATTTTVPTTTTTTAATTTTTDVSGTTATTTDMTTTTTDVSGTTATTSDTVDTTTTGSVSGTTGGPAPTLPPTSTEIAGANSNSGVISFALLILAAASLAVVLARPLSTRKNDR